MDVLQFFGIFLYTDSGKTFILVLMDLSSTFDTVDHKTILGRLEICWWV